MNQDNQDNNDNNKGEYRYKKGDKDIKIDSIDIKLKSKDTTINIKLNTMLNIEDTEKESGEETVANEKPTRVSSYTGHMISVFNMLGIADK